MFLAHVPAGYLLAKSLKNKIESYDISWKVFVITGLAGSILPDLDLLYFYLIDGRQHQHHSYWTHIPIYWFYIYLFTATISIMAKNKKMLLLMTFLFVEILLHLLLDTVTGGILWAYPLGQHYFVMVTITPVYSWWVLNFMFHWTFALELLIVFIAMTVYMKQNNRIYNKTKLLKNET